MLITNEKQYKLKQKEEHELGSIRLSAKPQTIYNVSGQFLVAPASRNRLVLKVDLGKKNSAKNAELMNLRYSDHMGIFGYVNSNKHNMFSIDFKVPPNIKSMKLKFIRWNDNNFKLNETITISTMKSDESENMKFKSQSPIKISIFHPEEVYKRKSPGDFQNNTNISLVNKYIYFAVDKVANSTIKKSLFEIEYMPTKKAILSLYDPRATPLLSPYQIPNDMMESILNDKKYFKFAFVRNPYSRLLSCYLDRILTLTSPPSRQFRRKLNKKDFDFSDFIKIICLQKSSDQNSHWRVQSDDILFDLVKFDHIAKFENLWDEMAYISKKIFGEVKTQMKDRKINSSPKKTGSDSKLKQYYTQELADIVYERYKADFINFGYDKLII